MKLKLILISLLFITGVAYGQAPTNDSTMFTAPSTPFSPQFRFKGTSASNQQLQYYNTYLQKWVQVPLAWQFNNYIGTATQAAITAAAADSTVYTTLNRYRYGADTLQNKLSYGFRLIGTSNGLVPTPANGVNIFGDSFPNSFSFKGANGHTALLNTGNFTQTNMFRLPNVTGDTLVTNNNTATLTNKTFPTTPTANDMPLRYQI